VQFHCHGIKYGGKAAVLLKEVQTGSGNPRLAKQKVAAIWIID
jgi:hypothetical protein